MKQLLMINSLLHRQSLQKAYVKVLVITIMLGVCLSEESLLQPLGFENWEEPTQQQIVAQYNKLSLSYSQKLNKQPEDKQKYERASEAFQKLKQSNFRGYLSSNQQKQDGFEYNTRNNRGNRFYRQHQQSNSRSSYRMNMNSNFELNLEDFMQDPFFFTEDLFKQQESQHSRFGQAGSLRFEIGVKDFLHWLLQNPIIFISAILISIGLINMCIFCCKCLCCCCCCRRDTQAKHKPSKDKKHNQGQQKDQQEEPMGKNIKIKRNRTDQRSQKQE